MKNTVYFKWFMDSLSESQRKEYRQMSINQQKDWYISYLESHFVQLYTSSDNVQTLKATFGYIIDLAEDAIHSMPQKGEKSTQCQRVGLQQAINEFSYLVNGITQEDLKE